MAVSANGCNSINHGCINISTSVGSVEEMETVNTGIAGTAGSNEQAYYDDGCVAGTQLIPE